VYEIVTKKIIWVTVVVVVVAATAALDSDNFLGIEDESFLQNLFSK